MDALGRTWLFEAWLLVVCFDIGVFVRDARVDLKRLEYRYVPFEGIIHYAISCKRRYNI